MRFIGSRSVEKQKEVTLRFAFYLAYFFKGEVQEKVESPGYCLVWEGSNEVREGICGGRGEVNGSADPDYWKVRERRD